jgi:hypothetical protein
LINSIEEIEKKWFANGKKDFSKLNQKTKEFKDYLSLKKQLDEFDGKEQSLIELQHTENKPYFLWQLWFKDVFDKGGFDIVIGNPPYGATYPEEYKKYFQNIYESAKTKEINENGQKIILKGSLDTFSLFIDKSLQIMNSNSSL